MLPHPTKSPPIGILGCFRCFFGGEPKLKLPSSTVAGKKSITSFNHFVATLRFILSKVYTVICWVKQSRKHDWFQGFREPQFLTPAILLLHFVDITVASQKAQTSKSLQVQLLSRNLINFSRKKLQAPWVSKHNHPWYQSQNDNVQHPADYLSSTVPRLQVAMSTTAREDVIIHSYPIIVGGWKQW